MPASDAAGAVVAAGAVDSAGALLAAVLFPLLLLPQPASKVPSTRALDKITEAFFILE
ncbi:hypothetical protein D3C81_2099980 [compost metagenome]